MHENVDVMILEVGLGGRLDAVNVFDGDCSVVTSVDLDHQAFLGDTVEQVGFEKPECSVAANQPCAVRILRLNHWSNTQKKLMQNC